MNVIRIMFCFTITLLSLLGNSSAKENTAGFFEGYKTIEINGHPMYVDKSLKYEIVNTDGLKENFGEGDKIARINCSNQIIDVGFSYGPSEDPNYIVVVRKNDYTITETFYAADLALSSSCNMYTSGHTNNNFNMRRKWTIGDSGITETEQPFYLVDQKCKINADTTLTTGINGKGTVVARLPKGSVVHILLREWQGSGSQADNDKENYLISTPFGLVGWVENYNGIIYGSGSPLSCIFYMGD